MKTDYERLKIGLSTRIRHLTAKQAIAEAERDPHRVIELGLRKAQMLQVLLNVLFKQTFEVLTR